jgi:hypothetical protein
MMQTNKQIMERRTEKGMRNLKMRTKWLYSVDYSPVLGMLLLEQKFALIKEENYFSNALI